MLSWLVIKGSLPILDTNQRIPCEITGKFMESKMIETKKQRKFKQEIIPYKEGGLQTLFVKTHRIMVTRTLRHVPSFSWSPTLQISKCMLRADSFTMTCLPLPSIFQQICWGVIHSSQSSFSRSSVTSKLWRRLGQKRTVPILGPFYQDVLTMA